LYTNTNTNANKDTIRIPSTGTISNTNMGNQLVPYCLSINLVPENYKRGRGKGN